MAAFPWPRSHGPVWSAASTPLPRDSALSAWALSACVLSQRGLSQRVLSQRVLWSRLAVVDRRRQAFYRLHATSAAEVRSQLYGYPQGIPNAPCLILDGPSLDMCVQRPPLGRIAPVLLAHTPRVVDAHRPCGWPYCLPSVVDPSVCGRWWTPVVNPSLWGGPAVHCGWRRSQVRRTRASALHRGGVRGADAGRLPLLTHSKGGDRQVAACAHESDHVRDRRWRQ